MKLPIQLCIIYNMMAYQLSLEHGMWGSITRFGVPHAATVSIHLTYLINHVLVFCVLNFDFWKQLWS